MRSQIKEFNNLHGTTKQDRDDDIRLGNFLEKLGDKKIHKITYISTSGVMETIMIEL